MTGVLMKKTDSQQWQQLIKIKEYREGIAKRELQKQRRLLVAAEQERNECRQTIVGMTQELEMQQQRIWQQPVWDLQSLLNQQAFNKNAHKQIQLMQEQSLVFDQQEKQHREACSLAMAQWNTLRHKVRFARKRCVEKKRVEQQLQQSNADELATERYALSATRI